SLLLLEKISHLASHSGSGGASGSFQTPKELPSQFVYHAHANISRWTVIVSDTTLFRIAARNKRIVHIKRKQLLTVTSGDDDQSLDISAAERTRTLIMNGAETITDFGLQAIAEHVPTLEALEIAHAYEITDAGLHTLALSCPNLMRLNLGRCRNIRGPGLGAIGDHCHRLTDLSLADCAHLGEWVIMRCLYGFTLLEHLNVARCPQITDHVLKTLANQCRRLRSLMISDCAQVSDIGIVYVAQHCHELEKIALNRVRSAEKITDTSCAALGQHCAGLKDVNLAGCNFLTDAAIQWVADGCPSLENLDISHVFYLTDVSLRALGGNCHALKALRLPNVKNVSDVGLRLLATGCPQLELLHVSNLYLVSDGSNRDFGLEGLRAIARDCKSKISHYPVHGCFHWFDKCCCCVLMLPVELKDLNLSGCFQLVERAVVALGVGCLELKRVSLKACSKITLLAVNALLHGCQLLVSLNLSGVLLCNNAMLAAIGAHCPKLRELFVVQCDKISDNGLRHLASRADQFEIMDFSGCLLISDTGLNYLLDGFQQPRMMHLYLVDCALITQDSIARLAFACPLLLTLSVHVACVRHGDLEYFGFHPRQQCRPPAPWKWGFSPCIAPKIVDMFTKQWLAVVKIQNLFRARRARQIALARKDEAMCVYITRRLQSMWRGRKERREAMIMKVIRSGLEKFAIKIQRWYRAKRQGRKMQHQILAIQEKQLGKYALMVQRRYRAKRAAKVARLIFVARKRQHEREVRAATQIQRRFRGISGKKRFDLLKIQKEACEREELAASLRIQTMYRGRADRKKVKELQRQKAREIEIMHQRATQLQAQFRRRQAIKAANARRKEIRQRERAATKLQQVYRAKNARQAFSVLKMASYHRECQEAARIIQKRWRTRKDRIGLSIVLEVRRQRIQRQIKAAIHLQHTFHRYLIQKRAQAVMLELLKLKQNDLDMEDWAAILVQSHWRRIQATKRLERIQTEKRTRWKQLVDTYNQHGMGYGAPFYYNQVNQEIRWRMPRELLILQPRPGCDQCEQPNSARFECATCCEYFCDQCNEIVHGHGKRQLHEKRRLFNFYGVRCDYGDGEFPSKWPSEIEQDRDRGYNFILMTPKENYQDMLWQIAQFMPVVTGNWNSLQSTSAAVPNAVRDDSETALEVECDASSGTQLDNVIRSVLYNESDYDDAGVSLWEPFYDYSKEEYRLYHRISKRVKSVPQANPAVNSEETNGNSKISQEQYSGVHIATLDKFEVQTDG
uniref:F-box/LRR-repeat protein 15-like leucin rich repeat domain-containing protein n=1 Tax=Globisporangium ultimum (strain ATCC 200006 / CBS 805.95 / DAOM BR144) TaxID=431595 RepID=K3WLQ7_GLOUD